MQNLIAFLLHPAVFFGSLCALFAVSVAVFLRIRHLQMKAREDDEKLLEQARLKIAEFERIIALRDQELEEKRNEKGALHEELAGSVKQGDILRLEQQQLRGRVTALEQQLAQQKEFGAKTSTLDQENIRLKQELNLANQMHEGLKGQYDELEEKFSQLFEQFLEEQKKNSLNMPSQPAVGEPR